MSAERATLPLFMLHKALLPGAWMKLRVFEPRYLDLVRECGRQDSGFGVCLILHGSETGAAALPAEFGTEARIVDFDVGPDGVLLLSLRGARRFHVARHWTRDNGLVMGDITWCEPDHDDELRPQHALLATLLESLLDQAAAVYPVPGPRLLDQAAWVGWRLAELLPLDERQRLSLLQQDDPHVRLEQLLAWIP
ncbi:LON peptidase substrate-binding domain-containing protein [Xanthomonas sp. GPE 39]|uniref:LON peptidase substrate-binding domain-containing protein n=1 Tax=Xanthomonas sp. GPE 39 TaxID=1583099 RepID=UPI000AA4B16F|nr:LON peptidase substrate-binding domain-containing protein [Xanthomonas sp. GPE 39]